MRKIINKGNALLTRTKFAVEDFWNEERGDTNFISIAIVLVVVIAIAIIFIGFGDWIESALNKMITDLKTKLNLGI